jgi:hypothetical protein
VLQGVVGWLVIICFFCILPSLFFSLSFWTAFSSFSRIECISFSLSILSVIVSAGSILFFAYIISEGILEKLKYVKRQKSSTYS